MAKICATLAPGVVSAAGASIRAAAARNGASAIRAPGGAAAPEHVAVRERARLAFVYVEEESTPSPGSPAPRWLTTRRRAPPACP